MPFVSEHDSNAFVERGLHDLAARLETAAKADVLGFVGPVLNGVEVEVRRAVECRKAREGSRDTLWIVLETPGGVIEPIQRMVETIRRHYSRIEFVIPDYAMSAGTVFAMSGDAIHMDYFSVLGPIDPQIPNRQNSALIPALGYLKQWERLVQKSVKGTLTTAELHYMTQCFDPAELYYFEQAQEHSIALLKEWLVRYKFKDWKETATRKQPVTDDMRVQRAEEIAAKLSDPDVWHSHGRGISAEVLRRDLNLLIDDFGKNLGIAKPIEEYHQLLVDFPRRLGRQVAVHTAGHLSLLGGDANGPI